MWPYIVGDTEASPRTEIMLDSQCYSPGSCVNGTAGKKSPCDPEHLCIGAIISGDFKLVLGMQKYVRILLVNIRDWNDDNRRAHVGVLH